MLFTSPRLRGEVGARSASGEGWFYMQYNPDFAIGSVVRISYRPVLEEFSRTWKCHHKLESEQLEFAGRVTKVVKIATYHGGDILYELEDVPGIWHEQCLETK